MTNTLAHLSNKELSSVVRAADLSTAVFAALKAGQISETIAKRAVTESLVAAFQRNDRTLGAHTWTRAIDTRVENLDQFSILEDGPLEPLITPVQPRTQKAASP